MKKGYVYSILFCSLIAFIFNSNSASGAEDKMNLPKIQGGGNDYIEYFLGGFPLWALGDSTAVCDSCGLRIYLFKDNEESFIRIANDAIKWKLDTVMKGPCPLEIFIPDSVLRRFGENISRFAPDTARVYIGAALKMYLYTPSSCYVVAEYPNCSEGFSLTDVKELGKEYILSSYQSSVDSSAQSNKPAISYAYIIGVYDRTRLSFTYGGAGDGYVITPSGKKLTKGMTDSILINRGDVYIITALGLKPDITGSYLRGDKPFQCFTGNSLAQNPQGAGKPGFIIEQESPGHKSENKYYIGPFKGAVSNSILRLFAAKDTTTIIYRDGKTDQVAVLTKKGGAFGEGWTEIRAAEGAPRAVTLFSDKRFKVVQYNANEGSGINSYPIQMNVASLDGQYGLYAVKPPRIKGSNQKNYVNIIHSTTPLGTMRKSLKVGEFNEKGDIVWSPLSEKFGVDLGLPFIDPTSYDTTQKVYCKQIELLDDKTYIFDCYENLLVYSYGYTDEGAYGFPLVPFSLLYENPDILAPYVHFTIDSLGNVPDPSTGKPAYVNDMPDDYKTRANLGVIYFDKQNSYNYSFKYEMFIPAEDRYTEWSLTPIDPKKAALAVITFTDRAGNDTTIIIKHKGYRLTVSPREADFEIVYPGEPKSLNFTITNESTDNKSLTISDLRLQKGDQGFSIKYAFDINEPIPPGESRDFEVMFDAPPSGGELSDSIGIGYENEFGYISFITARAASPHIRVSDVTFDSVLLNKTYGPIVSTIWNYGRLPLVITGFNGPTQSAFRVSLTNWGISPETPFTLEPGKSDGFDVYFTPTEKRIYLDSVVFESNTGSNGKYVCYLIGNALPVNSSPEDINSPFNVLCAKILPNPLDSRGGQLEFDNPSDGTVEIALFNSLNQQVAVLHSGWMKAGMQSIRIPVEALPSGAYTLRLISGEIIGVQNLIIAK